MLARMSGEAIDLRKRAEQRLATRPDRGSASPRLSAEALATEVEVHRIELDLQREEIERHRNEAIAARNRYAELCDATPAGLIVIDTFSRIVDANPTAWQLLGLLRPYERHTDLVLYLEWNDATKLRAALARGVSLVMDVKIRPRRRPPFHALLALSPDPRSTNRYYIALIDTSSRVVDHAPLALVADHEPGPLHVLVVEPYAPGRRALRDGLDELGFAIVTVETGEDVLRVAPARPPALLVADYQPGNTASTGVLDALRGRWPELPAVLLCRAREQATHTPPRSILLPKPVTLDDLERAIASMIGDRPPRR